MPKQNNLGQGGGGSELCQSSEATGQMDVSGSQPFFQCGYETHTTGQSSQSSEAVDIGEADGDEQGGIMQGQMEREDEDGLAVDLDSDEEDDEGNDEDVPIPDS